jgi:hypothetical protein
MIHGFADGVFFGFGGHGILLGRASCRKPPGAESPDAGLP